MKDSPKSRGTGAQSEATRKHRQRRDECRDWSVPRHGPEKSARIDLGLALLSSVALPGVRYSHAEIAAWCGCLDVSIIMIEQKALRKLRKRLLFLKDQRLVEMVDGLFDARRPAKRKEVA